MTYRASVAGMGGGFPKDTENTVGQFESPKNSEKRRDRRNSGEFEIVSNEKINIQRLG